MWSGCILDLAAGFDRPQRRPRQLPQHAEGIASLADFCRAHQAGLMAMEATGGYERKAFALLSGDGFAVAVLNPRSVRQFAASMGRMDQTDPLWTELDQAFRSIKGVADRTVARLMAELPEIGTLPHNAVSKLAGLSAGSRSLIARTAVKGPQRRSTPLRRRNLSHKTPQAIRAMLLSPPYRILSQ